MRVCPECRKQYADDVEACPDDGHALLEADRLPANPELRDVVPVSPTDHTAMIDLEAIEAERERRGLNRPKEPDATGEGDPADAGDDGEADEEEEAPHDPDATGTFHVDDLKGRERTQLTSAGSLMADPDDDEEDADDERHAPAERTERTELTRRPRFDDPTMGRAAARGQRPPAAKAGKNPKVLVAAVAGVFVVMITIAIGVFAYVSTRGAVLTVTSVPPGATVVLDGKELGVAPLQDRVAIGSHVLELSLEGYRPFKEVVDVPAEGLPFLQPLEPDPNANAAGPTTDGGPSSEPDDGSADGAASTTVASTTGDGGAALSGESAPSADELVASFDGLLAKADYDAALESIKELVKHHPDDARADGLFERLAEARIRAATSTKARPDRRTQGKRKLSAEEKKREAREAYAAGEALYREGSYAESRAKLREAIQLDPRFAQPHRAIARLYERDGDIARTRYHLDRYLRLGGKDPDYRVRRWLDDHKDD